MHRTKVVVGAVFVTVALVFLSVITYDYAFLDCADIGDINEMQEKSCFRTPNFYIFLAFSSIMLAFGSWLLIFGIKGLSMISGKTEPKGKAS